MEPAVAAVSLHHLSAYLAGCEPGFLLQLIAQFKIFDQVYLLTQGGPYNSTVVVLLYMYRQAFQQNRGGYAAAVAMALVIIMLIGTAVAFQAMRGRRSK